MCAVFPAASDGDGLCVRIDAVLDEFGNRLERVALRQSDNSNRIPVIPDSQFAAVLVTGFHPAQHSNVGTGSALLKIMRASLRRFLDITTSLSTPAGGGYADVLDSCSPICTRPRYEGGVGP